MGGGGGGGGGLVQVTAGNSEIPVQLFFISRLFMVRFSNGFQ